MTENAPIAICENARTSTKIPQPVSNPKSGMSESDVIPGIASLPAENTALPLVLVPGGSTTISTSAENLFKIIGPTKELFYRGGAVVELRERDGGYNVEVVDAVAAQSKFEKYVRFSKTIKVADYYRQVPTVINEKIAKQYLKSEACRDLLPELSGVIRSPLLIQDVGKLHYLTQGYDEITGFYVATSAPPEKVPLADAVGLLSGLLDDFDFVTPGDRSRALASFLTPALKLGGFINGPIPVDVAEANASQSGKTYRQKMVAALYNQKPAVVTKRNGGVGSIEETFSDHLVKGRPFIQFDNVRGKLDSQLLESFLTAEGEFGARIPYASPIAVDPSKFMLFISSNGFEATTDLTNRASIIRIRKRENHQFRTIDGQDVLQLIFACQPAFIGAVFAVIEDWYGRGKPKTNETRHDFREWCQILDWIVQNVFNEAPLMDGHSEAKQRASNPNLSFLRTVGIKLKDANKLNQRISASDIVDLCAEEDIEIPGLSAQNYTTDQARQRLGRIMSGLFKEANEIESDGFKIVRDQEQGRTEAGNLQTVNRYTFSVANPNNPTK